MKTIILIFLVFMFSGVFSQETKQNLHNKICTGIFYKLYSENPSSDNEAPINSLSLSNVEMKQFFGFFKQKIKDEKKFANYLFPGSGAPYFANYLSFDELSKINNKKEVLFEKVNDIPIMYYPEPQHFFTCKKDIILLDNQNFCDFKSDKFSLIEVEKKGKTLFLKIDVENQAGLEDISSISFFEEWVLNIEKVQFTKKVKFLGAAYRYEPDLPETCIFNLKTSAYEKEIVETTIKDNIKYSDRNLFKEDVHYNVFCVNNSMSAKSGYADNSFQFISKKTKDLLVYTLLKMAADKRIEVYSLFEDKPEKIIDYAEIVSDNTFGDTIIMRDDFGNEVWDMYGYPVFQLIEYQTYIGGFVGFRFHETWYFDKETFSMHKEVHGISLLKSNPDNDDGPFNIDYWSYSVMPYAYFKFK